MHFVYIDDSGDDAVACFSALIIPADSWRDSLDHLIGARRWMAKSDGVYIAIELHSTDWLMGKGQVGRWPIRKPDRARLFDFFLSSIAALPSAQLINACVPKGDKDRAFEYLLNRIQMNMTRAGSRCVIFCDEGKSYDHIRRRIGVYNPIRSRLGNWGEGRATKNIPADRILEDIVYRKINETKDPLGRRTERCPIIEHSRQSAHQLCTRSIEIRPLCPRDSL